MSLLKNIDLWGEDIPFLSGIREKGLTAFRKFGLPDAKTESWKYSYFKEEDLKNPQIDEEPAECGGHCRAENNLPFKALQIKYCNGKIHVHSSEFSDKIVIKSLAEAIFDGDVKKYLNKSYNVEDFPWAALNTAYLEQGLFISVEKGTVLSEPLYIHYYNHGDKNRLCHIHNIIVAKNNSSAVVIEHFEGGKNAFYTQNIVNEIYIEDNAEIRHYTWQNEAADAHHIALNSVRIKANGVYRAFYANKNCKYARHESYVCLLSKKASAQLNGVYRLTSQKQINDITANIRHLAEQTYSSQLVKGVAQAAAKGVFQGQIHIARNAQQCEGRQQHRALLLTDEAEIDCKPELEIFADDVKCSHGAASGDLDKEQLFYMQSRGLSEQEAAQILIKAYLEEVFSLNQDQNISEWIKEQF